MISFMRRRWRYFWAALTGRAEERADPKVQIEQAITEARRQHDLLIQQAAAVLGNEREVEIRLGRELDSLEQLKGSAGQALVLADQARAGGDTAKAAEFEEAALKFANQLTASESVAENLKELLDKAHAASTAAKHAVEQNALNLKQTLAERSKLLTQLEAARMQERINAAVKAVNEMSAPGEVPTLAEVREKIESRYARAMGQADLTSSTVDARMLEVQRSVIDQRAQARLDELRKDLGLQRRPAGSLEAAEPMPEFEQAAEEVARDK